MRRVQAVVGVAMLLSAQGCATIMSGRHADVTFYSNVPDACVVIRDKRGQQVLVTQAQSKVALKRNDRIIFPAQYTATFAAPGYQPVDVPIQSTVNPWVFGNIAFLHGGVVGLVVDSATGAVWSPKEETYFQELAPIGPGGGPMFSSSGPTGTPPYPVASTAVAAPPPYPAASLAGGTSAAGAPIYTASATNFVTGGTAGGAVVPATAPAAASPAVQ
jgi:hypothetical protein